MTANTPVAHTKPAPRPGAGATQRPADRQTAGAHLSTATVLNLVMEKALESLREIQSADGRRLTKTQMIRKVGEALVEKASTETEWLSVETGWQQLLEQGLKSKSMLLQSAEFKSTSEASELLGIGEPAVRKRIRDGKLFSIKMAGDGENRIPAWALDSRIVGRNTAEIMSACGAWDEWQIHYFMSTPSGILNGLRPFECLLSNEHLPPSGQALVAELRSHLGIVKNGDLLDVVMKALQLELAEGQAE